MIANLKRYLDIAEALVAFVKAAVTLFEKLRKPPETKP